MIFIDQFASCHGRLFFSRAYVYMDFRARSARTRLTHFPEVVVLVTVNDVVFGEVTAPDGCRLIVSRKALIWRTFKDSHIKVGGVYFQDADQIFISKLDGSFLKVVAKTPVAQHLKHRMMIRIAAHFFEVVVLATDAQTLLRVCLSATFRFAMAEDDVFKLIHPGIGKHQCGIVFDHHRS